MNATPIIAAGPTCGNCKFGHLVKEDLKVVECHGLPPTPAIAGMSPTGPAIILIRARLPRPEPACALHKPTLNIVASPAPSPAALIGG